MPASGGRYAFSDMPTLKRAAAEFLLARGSAGASALQIARVCLGSRAVPKKVADSLVRTLIGEDRRFAALPRGRWAVCPDPGRPSGRRLGSAVFTVVDVETTGTSSGSRIIEIGAVRVEGLKAGGTFETLVDAGVPVPSEISAMTGITREMLEGAPGPAEALGGLLEFMSDSIFVAHNASFDKSFIWRESLEYCGAAVRNPVVCTRQLARRAVPGLRSYSLDSVSAALGHSIGRRHRALDDALAAAAVLVASCEKLMELGVATAADLIAVQRKSDFDRFFKPPV